MGLSRRLGCNKKKIVIFKKNHDFTKISYLGGAHVLGVLPVYGDDHLVFGDDLKIKKKKIQKLEINSNLDHFITI